MWGGGGGGGGGGREVDRKRDREREGETYGGEGGAVNQVREDLLNQFSIYLNTSTLTFTEVVGGGSFAWSAVGAACCSSFFTSAGLLYHDLLSYFEIKYSLKATSFFLSGSLSFFGSHFPDQVFFATCSKPIS